MKRELYLTALRVLAKYASGEQQDERQVAELRRNALAQEANVSIDELCCRIINEHLCDPEARFDKLA